MVLQGRLLMQGNDRTLWERLLLQSNETGRCRGGCYRRAVTVVLQGRLLWRSND